MMHGSFARGSREVQSPGQTTPGAPSCVLMNHFVSATRESDPPHRLPMDPTALCSWPPLPGTNYLSLRALDLRVAACPRGHGLPRLERFARNTSGRPTLVYFEFLLSSTWNLCREARVWTGRARLQRLALCWSARKLSPATLSSSPSFSVLVLLHLDRDATA